MSNSARRGGGLAALARETKPSVVMIGILYEFANAGQHVVSARRTCSSGIFGIWRAEGGHLLFFPHMSVEQASRRTRSTR